MLDNWHSRFAPHILARGKTYFDQGNVCRIQHRGNSYIATVAGTDDYEVEIVIGTADIEEMFCTCPYGQEKSCKHMAAVLFALESETLSIEELPPPRQPKIVPHVPVEMPWLEAIDKLPEATVRKELLKLADRDPWLQQRLAILLLGKLPEGQLQNWKADLQQIAIDSSNGRGRINAEASLGFFYDLNGFLDRNLPLLLEAGAVMDAFHMIWFVMETATEWEVDDAYGQLDGLLDNCRDAFGTLLPIATAPQLEQMTQLLQVYSGETHCGILAPIARVFLLLARSDIPSADKRVIKYLGETPCFLYEGEWVSFPMRGHLYYDFVEETKAYKEALPIIEEIIKEKLGASYGCFGSCHAIWRHRQQLLKENYGIEWLSPSELNRSICFD